MTLKRVLSNLFVLVVVSQSLLFGQSVPSPRDYYNQGRSALNQDNPYDAIDSFRAAMGANPHFVEARLGMAEALFLLGEYGESLRELELAKPYARGNRELQLLEARILTALARYPESETLYRSLLFLRPHDSDAMRGLAELHAITGQWELATGSFERSLSYSPGDRRVLLQLVLLHDATGEQALAENALLEALSLYPDNVAVRIQAAEHYALYGRWDESVLHLERAKALSSHPEDGNYRRIRVLDASLALRRGDPASALSTLQSLGGMDEDLYFLLARAHREGGHEQEAQSILARYLSLNPNDEIARIYREDPFVHTADGFSRDRADAANWHITRGRDFEASFFYDRALEEYRRARLIDKDGSEAWLAYADLVRKKGFFDKYRDTISAALMDMAPNAPGREELIERRDLLDHSRNTSLAEEWGIEDPWSLHPSSWTIDVFLVDKGEPLLDHQGAEMSLGRYYASILDSLPNVDVTGGIWGRPIGVRTVSGFAEAFRLARESSDYMVILDFSESRRTFHCEAEVYLSRTGELLEEVHDLRTGEDRVVDTIRQNSRTLASLFPTKATILAIEGDNVLLDKGSWHGIGTEEPWIVLTRGQGRPAVVEGGVSYPPQAFLGSLNLTQVEESLSLGHFNRFGDFNFLAMRDEAYLISPPSDDVLITGDAPDPAFRTRLLSIP